VTKSVCTEAEEVELVQVCAVAYKLVQVKRVLAALRARALRASVLWLINTLRALLAHRSFACVHSVTVPSRSDVKLCLDEYMTGKSQ
jgi:hypothetical protein